MNLQTSEDTFVTLLTVAREDLAERNKILSILRLEPTRRKAAVNVLVMQMRREQAPQPFVEAWDSLQDDFIAEQARKILEDANLESKSKWLAAGLIIVVLILGVTLVWMLR